MAEEDVAVLALVDACGVPDAGLRVALALEDVAAVSPHRGGVLVHGDHAFHMGDFDGLAAAGAFAGEEGGDCADVAVHAAGVFGVASETADGFAVGFAVEVHVAADGVVGEDVGAPFGERAVEAERGDVDLDQALIGAVGGERAERARGGAFDDDVGVVEQAIKAGAAGFKFGDRFGGIAVRPARADLAIAEGVAGEAFALAAVGRAAERLDADDGGAVVGELLGGERAGPAAGDLDDAELAVGRGWGHAHRVAAARTRSVAARRSPSRRLV